jgi:3-phosphoshikimate 1-carboxyvinyltransferase
MGIRLVIDRAGNTVTVYGRGGRIDAPDADLFCGNSGTTIRFLTALCTLGKGTFVLDGVPRMRQRPIGQLLELLRNLGSRVSSIQTDGFPPVRVDASGLPGGIVRFGAAKSSQFLSAVLMVSPYARHEVRVDLDPGQTSWPYVAMTMRMMDEFGHLCELIRDPISGEPKRIIVPLGKYAATQYTVEPDASNATYFLAAAAIHAGSTVTIRGLGPQSLQGDVGFSAVLKRLGADVVQGKDSITVTGTGELEGIDVDLSGMPDTAQTLAVTALFAKGATTIRGLHTLRDKETDRLAAVSTELRKLGATVTVTDGDLTIEPPEKIQPAEIDTYDDHRMAMSFALAATRSAGVTIKNIECVAKTYPNFFNDLRRMMEAN